MRGDDDRAGHLFSYVSPERRVPNDHPLRVIRTMTDAALRRLSPRFETLYASTGRPSVPPEQLLRALLQEQIDAFAAQMAAGISLGRVGTPEEVSRAVLFLASCDASYVNGIELFVDGGMAQV